MERTKEPLETVVFGASVAPDRHLNDGAAAAAEWQVGKGRGAFAGMHEERRAYVRQGT
jgi:hypothetical protein